VLLERLEGGEAPAPSVRVGGVHGQERVLDLREQAALQALELLDGPLGAGPDGVPTA